LIQDIGHGRTKGNTIIKFTEEFKKNHPDYNLLLNNCKTFGKAVATVFKEGNKCK